MVHPRWGIAFGAAWSISSRKRRGFVKPFDKKDKELILNLIKDKQYDFVIFGHRHLTIDVPLNENCRYINTGEWFVAQSYAVFDGKNVTLSLAKRSKN